MFFTLAHPLTPRRCPILNSSLKNLFTKNEKPRYAESLKTEHTASAPSICGLFYALLGDENRKYIEYRSKLLCSAFSESPAFSIKAVLKKEHIMTKNQKKKAPTEQEFIEALRRLTKEQQFELYGKMMYLMGLHRAEEVLRAETRKVFHEQH